MFFSRDCLPSFYILFLFFYFLWFLSWFGLVWFFAHKRLDTIAHTSACVDIWNPCVVPCCSHRSVVFCHPIQKFQTLFQQHLMHTLGCFVKIVVQIPAPNWHLPLNRLFGNNDSVSGITFWFFILQLILDCCLTAPYLDNILPMQI